MRASLLNSVDMMKHLAPKPPQHNPPKNQKVSKVSKFEWALKKNILSKLELLVPDHHEEIQDFLDKLIAILRSRLP
jgi:hypothetical protein